MSRCVLLLSLLWSLVEVHSQQTFPYVFFMGQTLANHSYVNLSLVGDYASSFNSVRCHTDLNTCCNNTQGSHRGDWYFPDETRLPLSGDIYEHRVAQRVELRRQNSATSPVGIYRCDIPTTAVHDNDDISVRETVYVGLYTASEGKQLHVPSDNEFGELYSRTSVIRTLWDRRVFRLVKDRTFLQIF